MVPLDGPRHLECALVTGPVVFKRLEELDDVGVVHHLHDGLRRDLERKDLRKCSNSRSKVEYSASFTNTTQNGGTLSLRESPLMVSRRSQSWKLASLQTKRGCVCVCVCVTMSGPTKWVVSCSLYPNKNMHVYQMGIWTPKWISVFLSVSNLKNWHIENQQTSHPPEPRAVWFDM